MTRRPLYRVGRSRFNHQHDPAGKVKPQNRHVCGAKSETTFIASTACVQLASKWLVKRFPSQIWSQFGISSYPPSTVGLTMWSGGVVSSDFRGFAGRTSWVRIPSPAILVSDVAPKRSGNLRRTGERSGTQNCAVLNRENAFIRSHTSAAVRFRVKVPAYRRQKHCNLALAPPTDVTPGAETSPLNSRRPINRCDRRRSSARLVSASLYRGSIMWNVLFFTPRRLRLYN